MNIEHFAIASNSEGDSDTFFMNLLGLKKERTFEVSEELMEKFFGIKKKQQIVRYANQLIAFEVFITNDESKSKDIFTHVCIKVKDREKLIQNCQKLGFKYVKVPRKDSEGYYLFIKDNFGNLFEIKS
ncbi:MAG: VOC family protein [Promethearchaeota archaeon]